MYNYGTSSTQERRIGWLRILTAAKNPWDGLQLVSEKPITDICQFTLNSKRQQVLQVKIIPWKTVPPGRATISTERLTTSSVSIMTTWNGKKYNSPSLNHKPCHKFVLQTCVLYISKSIKSQETFYSSICLELHSLQLCVFATVQWVEIILYSAKK